MNGLSGKVKFCLVIVVLLSMGTIFFTPVLKNADDPFIEISGSVGEAVGNAKEAYIAANPTATPRPIAPPRPTATPKPTATPTPVPVIKDIEIVVADEELSCEGYKSTTATDFMKEFDPADAAGRRVVLVDDYAEAKTFKKLLKYLDSIGFTYDVERRKQ